MTTIELDTTIGKFKFNLLDAKILKRINTLKFFSFVHNNKNITLFSNVLKTAKTTILR